jgi:hypothetical protein
MSSPLATLRQNAIPVTPAKFLHWHPGCWIQYYDDTAAKNPSKALSSPTFNPDVLDRKQRDRCAATFSLQAFKGSRSKEELLSYRNLGVDVDLVRATEYGAVSQPEIDRRKDDYLTRLIRPFPLRVHWLIETSHGFHLIFRVMPVRDAEAVRKAEQLNRRLVRLLDGDDNAVLLTQVLRIPGTYQFKDPAHPFLCRLLLNSAATIPPHEHVHIEHVLDAWEQQHPRTSNTQQSRSGEAENRVSTPKMWRDGLTGVHEGHRNATAASLVGKILGRMPEELWGIAGWGGLREWNTRNAVPLPEWELRTVFESIARRERARRQGIALDTVEGARSTMPPGPVARPAADENSTGSHTVSARSHNDPC